MRNNPQIDGYVKKVLEETEPHIEEVLIMQDLCMGKQENSLASLFRVLTQAGFVLEDASLPVTGRTAHTGQWKRRSQRRPKLTWDPVLGD